MPFSKKQNEDLAHDFATNNRHPVNSTLDRAPPPSNKPRSSGTQCVVDTWLLITGDLAGEGELQVNGKVNGNIQCIRLIVGKAAVINGNVTADEVVVRGEVNGVIRAHRVILQDSARVKSDIFHKMLCVDEGARVEGAVRLNKDPINTEVLNPHIVEVQVMVAKMQSSGSDPARHAATTNSSAA